MIAENRRPGKVSPAALILALTLGCLALTAVFYGARNWFPPLASDHGSGIDRMLNYLMITVGTIFLAGHLVLGYLVWRFSRPNGNHSGPSKTRTELAWSLIPALIITLVAEGGVLVIGLPVWDQLYGSAAPPGSVTVEITAEQFAWNVRYPGGDAVFGRTDPQLMSIANPLGIDPDDPAVRDDIVMLGELYLPVDRPARIRLRSKDVLHSFFLPNLRVKQDAVPGMTIDFWFTPNKAGDFEIACAELCGFAHFQMRGLLHVIPQSEFEAWLGEEPPVSAFF